MLLQTSWLAYEIARIRAFDNNALLDFSFTALSQCSLFSSRGLPRSSVARKGFSLVELKSGEECAMMLPEEW